MFFYVLYRLIIIKKQHILNVSTYVFFSNFPTIHIWNFWYCYIYNSKILKRESTLGNNYVYTRLLMLQLWYKKGYTYIYTYMYIYILYIFIFIYVYVKYIYTIYKYFPCPTTQEVFREVKHHTSWNTFFHTWKPLRNAYTLNKEWE